MRVASPVTRPIPLRVGLLHRPLLAEKEIKHEKFDLCARARGENGWGQCVGTQAFARHMAQREEAAQRED